MAMWNPWRGCRRFSEGCRYCYIHKGDQKRGVDTSRIIQLPDFDAPVRRLKNGEYKMKSGQLVYLCFSTDFLLEDADGWREACWDMIRERQDLTFLFLTKRIHRMRDCLPADWGDGWDNVIVGCTVENQQAADERLAILDTLPILHKQIICQPMIGPMDLSGHLQGVEAVTVGGESDRDARVLNYDWVLSIRQQCVDAGVDFTFRQCGTHFCKDGKLYHLNVRDLCKQARLANIHYSAKEAKA